MNSPPPISTRTDTLFPYKTLCRSVATVTPCCWPGAWAGSRATIERGSRGVGGVAPTYGDAGGCRRSGLRHRHRRVAITTPGPPYNACLQKLQLKRSEERRVGKECVSTCRSRCAPYHLKKKIRMTISYILYT